MFVDTVKVEGLIVDEELSAGDLDGTDAHRQTIQINRPIFCYELNLKDVCLLGFFVQLLVTFMTETLYLFTTHVCINHTHGQFCISACF